MSFDVNNWLHNVYGLPEDGCLSVGEVSELAEMLGHDATKQLEIATKALEELEDTHDDTHRGYIRDIARLALKEIHE